MVVFSRRAGFEADGKRIGGEGGRQAAPAEFGALLIGGRPEMRSLADGDAAEGVHGDDRSDGEAAGAHRGRAEPAFQSRRHRAGAGPDAAGQERRCGLGRGGIAEFAIGRVAPPVLVAAVARSNRMAAGTIGTLAPRHGEAATLFGEAGHRAGGGIEPEGRTAGQHQRVDALDGALEGEQVGLARSRRAAAHVDRSDRRLVEDDGGDAGAEPQISGIPDLEAGDVGDEVAHPGLLKDLPRRCRSTQR